MKKEKVNTNQKAKKSTKTKFLKSSAKGDFFAGLVDDTSDDKASGSKDNDSNSDEDDDEEDSEDDSDDNE